MANDEEDHELAQQYIAEEAGGLVDDYDKLSSEKQQQFLDSLSSDEKKLFQKGLKRRGRG